MEMAIPWALYACWHSLDLRRFKIGGMQVIEDIRVPLCPFSTAHTMPPGCKALSSGCLPLGAQPLFTGHRDVHLSAMGTPLNLATEFPSV